MTDSLRQYIPTPAQMQALIGAFDRLNRVWLASLSERPLPRRAGPWPFGRKRRARRARGRRPR
jgi:hypothetical protein